MSELTEFRDETRAWLEENCPSGARGPGPIAWGSSRVDLEPRPMCARGSMNIAQPAPIRLS